MTHLAGHCPTAVRRVPADTALPAAMYVALCQCGRVYTEPLRVVAEDALRYHSQHSPQVKGSGWWCPCGTESRTRRLRTVHMSVCDSAPEGWRR